MPEILEPKEWKLGIPVKVKCSETTDYTQAFGPSAIRDGGVPKCKAQLSIKESDLFVLSDAEREIFLRLVGPRHNKEKQLITFSSAELVTMTVRLSRKL